MKGECYSMSVCRYFPLYNESAKMQDLRKSSLQRIAVKRIWLDPNFKFAVKILDPGRGRILYTAFFHIGFLRGLKRAQKCINFLKTADVKIRKLDFHVMNQKIEEVSIFSHVPCDSLSHCVSPSVGPSV